MIPLRIQQWLTQIYGHSQKRKRVLLSYTNLEDGRYDLTFSKDFIIFRDLILIMVKEYDKRISNR